MNSVRTWNFTGVIRFSIGWGKSLRFVARQTVVSVEGGVSNPSAVIDDISRERGKEKFQSSISAILCLVESKSFVPSPRSTDSSSLYREGGSRAEIPKCVFLFWKKITRGIYKFWGSKFRGNKKIIQETSRNYFSRFFENSKNFHSHSRCTINKFYSTPLEISLGQIFFHARVNISPDIFTAMADFYV